MEINELVGLYKNHPCTRKLIFRLQDNAAARICLKGLHGSSRSLVAASVISSVGGLHLMIEPEREDAAYLYNDLVNLLGPEHMHFFPSSYKRSIQYNKLDQGNAVLRANLLTSLYSNPEKEPPDPFRVIVCYAESIAEMVVSKSKHHSNTFHLSAGERITPAFLHEVLERCRFHPVDFVTEPGQYSMRGSITDVFSYSESSPYRIDFSGDVVETIRSFDVETQLSGRLLEQISIVPDIRGLASEYSSVNLFEHIDPSATLWINNISFVAGLLDKIFEQVCAPKTIQEDVVQIEKWQLFTGDSFLQRIASFQSVELSSQCYYPDALQMDYRILPQPSFNKNFNLLAENLAEQLNQGYKLFILSNSEKQFERLVSIFYDLNNKISFTPLLKSLHEGFIDRDILICCYTDHQIFERYHRYSIHNYFSTKAALTLKELTGLKPGDYVVHIDHGIGIFGGLEKIVNNGKIQESVRLVYRDQDVLYVSIHSLHRISKYKGRENEVPKLHKLGSNAWNRLKQNTKSRIKDIARGLITLYATRKLNEGFAFSADTYLQTELEASFVYEDTIDQLKTTVAIKEDMESRNPMDRLVCGDVGFGKTEVAIRAAFKAVADSKQVALLVPTTILALQHYNTFCERLKDFPCNVEYINRFKKGKQQSEIIRSLTSGRTDVIIGTHRLLSNDIQFKDLGLLIIDEEQKFGVSAKEKLRKIRSNVDTLTLTATPIPRTLQFSLMGVRDLSVINTPPPNRHPIVTELHSFEEEIIREGIEFETSRGGQVFFIHNRIQNIHEVSELIHKLCPRVSICVAHGQMSGRELESNMTGFIRGDYDVLVATAIIESGLDIPNANTIFVNNAHYFGLSDLHQLRGRVGRSNRKAFCYLLAPSSSLLTPEARKRLKAIEEFSELGSGFNIAMQDLDIRGAGNLLGAEQSGFIADVGFETYNRILSEAIQELREDEFPELKTDLAEKSRKSSSYAKDCQIDTDLELLFPDDYIASISERMFLYRELDQILTDAQLKNFRLRLADRFGPLPEQASELLKVVSLRQLAIQAGFEKIILKNRRMTGYFPTDQDSPYYRSEEFSKILYVVQQEGKRFRMKEDKNKLILTCEAIGSVQEAIEIFRKFSSGQSR
ncbi:MAG: transcription-repair coupling factor [Bacteroidales bacterium]|nr:transcription-repair coupling factor [Bacteroidales bacterium]